MRKVRGNFGIYGKNNPTGGYPGRDSARDPTKLYQNGIRIFLNLLDEGFSRAKAQAIAGIDDETVESALQVGQSNTI